jgi:uncharacterized protein (DUF2147 family)
MFCAALPGQQDQNIVGFWKTIDEKSEKPQSIIAVYGYQNKYYGRIVVTYDENGQLQDSIENPKNRAPGVKGNPFYSGLDIIWNLQSDGSHFTNGKILDPEKGRIYGAEMWVENGKLIVRGKILMFGRNQTWLAAADHDFPPHFTKPDLQSLVPSIPQVNRLSKR